MTNTIKKCINCSNVLTTEQLDDFGHWCDETCERSYARRHWPEIMKWQDKS